MKRLVLSFVAMTCFGVAVRSQHCADPSGASVCNDLSQSTAGFSSYDDLPCAEQGQAYDEIIKFMAPPQWPQPVTAVNSIKLASITNLPCGLCWRSNKANDTYNGGESGCIRITGTTTDAVGQYKLSIIADANVGNPPTDVNGVDISQYESILPSLAMYVRVKAGGGSCPNVNTAGGTNTASPSPCSVGIEESQGRVSNFRVLPTAFGMVAKFESAEFGNYEFSVADYTGKKLSTIKMEVWQGENSVVLSTEQLSSGFYVATVSNGKDTYSTKFNIIR